jgi:hypothetical protein
VDKDGKLTKADFRPDTWARIKHLDRNPADGVLSEDEFGSMRFGLKPTGSGERPPDAAPKAADEILSKLDANNNQVIDETEMPAGSTIFRRADSDRDGRVTRAELIQLLQSQTAISP